MSNFVSDAMLEAACKSFFGKAYGENFNRIAPEFRSYMQAALEAAMNAAWRPIDEAPKDLFAELLACHAWVNDKGETKISWAASGFFDENGVWIFDTLCPDPDGYNEPNYWMTLPPAPEAKP